MPVRTNGGVFNSQMLTGALAHYVVQGADFSGAIDSFGQPVPDSAAEIIFTIITASAEVEIMNPNSCNLSFALQAGRTTWDEYSLTAMIRGLGTDVGVDHVNCSLCTAKRVPYIWACGSSDVSFLNLTDTPSTYAGSAGYVVTVNPTSTGLIFTPGGGTGTVNTFSTISSLAQPSIIASGSDTLTFVAGNNISITTNATAKSIRIDSTGTGSSSDYIPVPPGTLLAISKRYFITAPGTVTLPITSGITAGQSVIIAKKVSDIVFVNVGAGTDIIATDLGSTNSVEFDATQEIILVYGGSSIWNLQIGSYNY